MEELAEFRAWEELIPDALGLIFSNLPLQQILSVVPRVCKSWSRAVSGPYCWQEIDLEDWSRRADPNQIERMLHLLVRRSSGYCRRLSVSGIPNDSLFSFIADYAGSLHSLEMPRSEMSDAIVELVAGRLSNITFLDISSCKNIGARALKSFGTHCKSLRTLRRTMHPLEVAGKVSQDDEALAIALTMPRLRHLELAYLRLTTEGVLQILSHCQDLRFLDVRGCWDVQLDEKFIMERFPELKILGPDIVDSYEGSFWNECSDYSDADEYSWEFMDDDDDYDDDDDCIYVDMSDEESEWDDDDDDEQNGERLQVRFYGGGFNEAFAGFEWPLSP